VLNIAKMGLVLGAFCVAAALALGGTYEMTKDKIAIQRENVMKEALSGVLPEAKKIIDDTIDGKTYYKGYATEDATGEPIGYAIIAEGVGYSSTIRTLVGLTPEGIINKMNIIYQLETPGLGTKAVEIRYGEEDPWFQRQFLNLPGDSVAVDKDGGQIVSISGSTITARAIASSIKRETEWLKAQGVIKPGTK
jgi:electron transport complex protein RnfG